MSILDKVIDLTGYSTRKVKIVPLCSIHDTTVSQTQEQTFDQVRKAVKQLGKEATTHRFTLEEKSMMAELVYTYRTMGVKTSENEITRIAINYLLLDYQENGPASILAKMLDMLNV